MLKKLFVGNLDWGVTAEDLKNAFSKYGEVTDGFVVSDKFSGRSKGFGFVTIELAEGVDGSTIKEEMQGFELKGREINVDDAHDKED